MTRMIVFFATTVLGAVGWAAGAYIGIFSAFALSMVGTGLGIYYGKQLADRWGA